MAKFPRRGKGSDKTTDEGKISNSVSASDGTPSLADEAYTPSAPKPPQPPKAGRTDLNAAQGFQRQQQMASHTTPQMSRRERARLDAMKGNAPEPSSPAPRGMGSSPAPEPEIEQAEFVRLTPFEIDRLAMQSVRDYDAGREAADLSHVHPDDFRVIEDRVPFAQDRFDQQKTEWQGVAQQFSLSDMTMMTAEGEQGATITSDGTTYTKDGDFLVGYRPGTDPTWHEFAGVYDAVAAKPESQEQMAATFPGGDRHAVFFSHEGNERLQFTDSLPWRNDAVEDLNELRAVLSGAGEHAVADRLYVSVLTPYERAVEQVEQREPQEGQRHQRAYAEVAGEQFPSLSTPAAEVPQVLSPEDHKAVVDAFDQAPALAAEQGAERVRDALPREGRADTVEGLRAQYQWHANHMFEEGRDLKDIYTETGLKPEGADQTAWEKTEYVYGQPTALDKLQDLGTGAFAASESGYTYALSADGKELIRFDADLQIAGRKPVEDVQAFLQEKRGVEFDQKQEEKLQAAPQVEQQQGTEAVELNRADTGTLQIVAEKQEVMQGEQLPTQEEAVWSQSKEYADEAVQDMNQMASQPATEGQKETAALLRGDLQEVQQSQAVEATPQEAAEIKQEVATNNEGVSAVEQPEMEAAQEQDKAAPVVDKEALSEFTSHEVSFETSKTDDLALPVDLSEMKAEEASEVKSGAEETVDNDLTADFEQSKAAYEAKQPEQEKAQEIAVGTDVQQKAVVEDDLRSDFEQSKDAYDAKQSDQMVQEAVKSETSQQVSNEPEDNLTADFEVSKAKFEEQQANPPEPAVQHEEEEERNRGMAA
ncbi:hypothetical protein V6R85_23910 [Agrobacterium sp. CCNWLW32]|uniref:hypothetical protein n=1 Tax=Agrobacterium sp. CCNWLW32 TaxID=3122072 RepID=UPI00300FF82F